MGDTLNVRTHVADQHGNGVSGIEVQLDASGACKAKPLLQETDDAGNTPASSWEMGDNGSCVMIATTTNPTPLETRITVPVEPAARRK